MNACSRTKTTKLVIPGVELPRSCLHTVYTHTYTHTHVRNAHAHTGAHTLTHTRTHSERELKAAKSASFREKPIFDQISLSIYDTIRTIRASPNDAHRRADNV